MSETADAYNVVLVVLDTVRARQLGLYGRDRDPMPNLTRFAEEATTFDRAYTNAPWTVPAHATLFTGELPSEHGCHGGSLGFTTDHPSLAETLSEHEYRTYGVSNNVWISDHFQFDAGFDEFYKEWQLFRQSREIGHALKERDLSSVELVKKIARGNPAVNVLNGLYGKYLYRRTDFGAARTTEHVSSLLEEASDPFFLFANYMEGHAPFVEHECTEQYLPDGLEDASRYTDLSGSSFGYHTGREEVDESAFEGIESLYDGELRYLDRRLGQLFDALRDRDLLSESIVVVVGDHGENLGDHGRMAHRFSVHDTLLHVPLVVRHPDHAQGERVDDPVDFTDLHRWLSTAPTGADDPRTVPTDGPVVAEYLSTEYTPEAQDDEFAFEGSEYDRRLIAVLTADHKLTVADDGSASLYDYDGGPDFELDGERISDPDLESRLREHCTGFDREYGAGVDERGAVEEHLKELGYME